MAEVQLKCPRCDSTGKPIVERQDVKCYSCLVKFPWAEAGKYLSALRAEKQRAQRIKDNKSTTRRYKLHE